VEVKQFDQGQIIFGRPGSEVDLFLDDDSVSPIHCLIEKREDKFYICDLGSQSGTLVNQVSILDHQIESGDSLIVGLFKIEFFVGAPKPKVIPVTPAAPPSQPMPNLIEIKLEAPLPPPRPVEPIVLSTISRAGIQNQPGSVKSEIVNDLRASEAHTKNRAEHNKDTSEVPKLSKTVVINSANVIPSRGIKKKATFSKKSEIADLKSYLRPSSGMAVQVVVAWHERVLNAYNFNRAKASIMVGPSRRADLTLPGDLSTRQFSIVTRVGEEIDVFIPSGSSAILITSSAKFDSNDLKKMSRLQPGQFGNIIRLQNNEIINIRFENSPIEIYVRRNADSLPIRPVGFIDISSGEMTGLIVSMVVVALVALYMTVYAPIPEESLNTEEVRLAQFIYSKPPAPPVKVQPEPESENPPPPPKVEPKKIKVTEEKIEQKPTAQLKASTKAPQKSGGQSSEIRPSPSKVVRPVKQTSVKQGGSVKLGETEGANAASKEKDVSRTGLLSAFGGGGNRSKLDKAYSGSGELLGAASQASGFTGQNRDRAGDDIGSRFKDDGAGGKGISTQGIANLGTKGRGSGNAGYGAVGDGDGKGRVTIDVPGTNAEFVGTIDREAVRRVIRSILSQIRSCYEKQLRLNPTLGGKIVVTFEIAERGQVTVSAPKTSTLPDPEVGRCVAARIQSQRFPEPPAGTIAVVDYPFVFDSQK